MFLTENPFFFHQAGVSGERGEAWAAAQVGILLFVLLGNLPFLGGSLEIVAGPGLLLGGAGLSVVSKYNGILLLARRRAVLLRVVLLLRSM